MRVGVEWKCNERAHTGPAGIETELIRSRVRWAMDGTTSLSHVRTVGLSEEEAE